MIYYYLRIRTFSRPFLLKCLCSFQHTNFGRRDFIGAKVMIDQPSYSVSIAAQLQALLSFRARS